MKNCVDGINEFYGMNNLNIDKFAECAALAYKDYPLFKYLTNNTCDHNVIKQIISSSIYAMGNNVVGYSYDNEINAVALFVPPQYKGTKTIPFLINGGIKLTYMAPFTTFQRLLNYEGHSMKLKKNHTNHESWYLYNVTVKPAYQNMGLGSKLLIPMFEYFDKTGQDCYLETHNENNIKFYEKFGFNLVEISNIPKTNIKHYSMVRKPNK